MVKRSFLSFCLLAVFFLFPSTATAKLEMRVDRNPVPYGQSVTLTVEARSEIDGDLDVSALEIDFDLLGQSQSRSLSYRSGKASRLTSWHLTLMPKRSGDLTIPSLRSGSLRSDPLILRVKKPDNRAPNTTDTPFFIQVELSDVTPVVGSQVRLDVKLYLGRTVQQGAVLTEPEFPDDTGEVRRIGSDRIYDTRLDGATYQVVERSYLLFPQKEGRIDLEPLLFEGQEPRARALFFSQPDPSAPVYRVLSAPITLNVLPLPPEARNALFAATEVELRHTWSPDAQKLEVGDVVNHRLSLRVTGQLPDAIRLPGLSYPDSFKRYEDKPSREESIDGDTLRSRIELETALIPTEAGKPVFPGFEFSWWDSDDGVLRQTQLPKKDWDIVAAAQQSAAPPSTSRTPQEQDIPAETVDTKKRLEPSTTEKSLGSLEDRAAHRPLLPYALATCFFMLWLATLLLFLRERARKRSVEPAQSCPDDNLRSQRRRLETLCREGRPGDILPQLLRWGQLHFRGEPPANLNELARLLPTEATAMLRQLSEEAAKGAETFSAGKTLLRSLPTKPQQLTSASSASSLAPLYPED